MSSFNVSGVFSAYINLFSRPWKLFGEGQDNAEQWLNSLLVAVVGILGNVAITFSLNGAERAIGAVPLLLVSAVLYPFVLRGVSCWLVLTDIPLMAASTIINYALGVSFLFALPQVGVLGLIYFGVLVGFAIRSRSKAPWSQVGVAIVTFLLMLVVIESVASRMGIAPSTLEQNVL
ncbi:MAG: hypothetical protein HGA47_11640 [Zoogloea sp.]|nr:hypothetical protein [Zoogloea sp.]